MKGLEEPTQALVKTDSVLVKIQNGALHNSRQKCYSFNQPIQKFPVTYCKMVNSVFTYDFSFGDQPMVWVRSGSSGTDAMWFGKQAFCRNFAASTLKCLPCVASPKVQS
jgi:hypothetical protein